MRTHARQRTAAILLTATLVLVLGFLLSGCSIGNDTASLPRIGERASNDAMAVTVNSVKFYDSITSESGTVYTPSNGKDVYVVVDMTIENVGDKSIAVDPRAARLTLVGGKYQQGAAGSVTTFFPKELDQLKTGRLGAGKTVRGRIVYVIPKGETLEKIAYAGDPAVAINLGAKKVRPPAAPAVPRVGQTATGGGLAMTVRSVTYPKKLTHGLWTTTAKPGAKMVVVNLSLRNVDRKPSYTVNPLDVVIVDNKGKLHISASFGVLGMPESEKLQTKRLKPGASEAGKVVISIAKNRRVSRIRYDVGVLGPPLEVQVGR